MCKPCRKTVPAHTANLFYHLSSHHTVSRDHLHPPHLLLHLKEQPAGRPWWRGTQLQHSRNRSLKMINNHQYWLHNCDWPLSHITQANLKCCFCWPPLLSLFTWPKWWAGCGFRCNKTQVTYFKHCYRRTVKQMFICVFICRQFL